MHEHGEDPVGGPEIDDTTNPTDAAPGDRANDFGGDRASAAAQSGEEAWSPDSDQQSGARGAAGREMLVQLQQMIDTLATQAAPVMREVAAKAAELAAVAGQKAGPVAYRAAGVAQNVGERVAARSKEMATELRRQPESGATTESDASATTDTDSDRTDDPKSSDWTAS